MIGRFCFYFLLYTFIIFFGAPTYLLVLQAAAIALCAFVIFRNRLAGRRFFPRWLWMVLLGVALYIAFSMLQGISNAPTTGAIAFRAALNFFLTLCIPLIAYAYLSQGVISAEAVLRHFTLAVMLFSLVKCAIVLAVAIFGIPIPVLQIFFSTVFHASPMFSMITSTIIRFGTASDYAVPFALYYLLSRPAMGWITRWIGLLLMALCLFISFSRYVWLMSVVALAVWYLSLPRRTAFAILLVGAASFPVIASQVDFSPVIGRFASSATTQSDAIRVLQYDALSRDMDGNLLFGHGWATFRVDMIRDASLPYSYEMQWLALLYQIGLIGIIVVSALVLTVLLPYRNVVFREWGMIILFLLAVLAALTNPVLLGRAPGAVYTFVAFYGIYSARRWTPKSC